MGVPPPECLTMNRWTAPSDLDYEVACAGRQPKTVLRTCANCGEEFRMVVEGEYQGRVWCEDCARIQRASEELP